MAPSFIRRSPSPARSTSDDDEEEEEDFDVDQSHFYVDDNTIDQPQPQSPAQAQFQWINQLHRLSLSSPNGSGLYGCSDIPPHSPANTLPHEILIHVFKHVHSNRDLHSALLVSRAWCQCSVELLWHKPSFSGLASLFKLLHIITRKDQIFSYATFIRRLNFANQALDLNDQLFQRLSSCIRLERLTLVGCSLLTDTALIKVFTACPNLVALDLTHVTEVTDKSVIALATSARKLQGINLGYCKKVTDEGIFALAHLCPLLRRVKLHGLTSLTNDSISALAKRCPLLLEIDLNLCNRVTDTAVRDLWKHCYHLRELRLSHVSELSDDAFPVPPPAPKTNGNGVNPFPPQAEIRTISPLLLSRPFDHLRLLDLTSCAHLTDEAIEGIISNTPKIRHLTLAKCTSLTDDAVISVSKLGRYLHYLHLGHVVSVSDRSITQLARSCLRLRYVDLACCSNLTDLSVLELSALPKLRRIGLVHVPNLTDQAVLALADRYSSLERIHLSYCEQISVQAVYHLLQKLHKLTHLSLTGVPAFRVKELQRFCRAAPREFNVNQRAAFCVFSGSGIADLRRYLHGIAHEMDRIGNEPDEPGGRSGSDSDDVSTADDAILLPRHPNAPPPAPPGRREPSSSRASTAPPELVASVNGRHNQLQHRSDPNQYVLLDLPYHPRTASSSATPTQRSQTSPFYGPRPNSTGTSNVVVEDDTSNTSTATASSSSIPLNGGYGTPDLNYAETGRAGPGPATNQRRRERDRDRGREPRSAQANLQPHRTFSEQQRQQHQPPPVVNLDPRVNYLSPPTLPDNTIYANPAPQYQFPTSQQSTSSRQYPFPPRQSTSSESPTSSRRGTVRAVPADGRSSSMDRELEESVQAAFNGGPLAESPDGRGRERGRRVSVLRSTINAAEHYANALFGRGPGGPSSSGPGGERRG